jgi:hypothetical protein
MRAYRKFALVSFALWVTSTAIIAIVMALDDRAREAELDAILSDLDAIKTERRIVLVGSSNVVLGLSAEQLSKSLGIPARNTAAYAARNSFDDYFRLVMERVRPNDLVLVSAPMGIVALETGSEPFSCKDRPMPLCVIRYWKLAPRLLELIRDPFWIPKWPAQRTSEGDAVFSQDRERGSSLPAATNARSPKFSENSVAIVRVHIQMIRARGACAAFAFPPRLVYDDNKPAWEEEFARAKAAFKAAGLEDALVGSMLVHTNPRDFLNDAHHMSSSGREIWTQMLVKDLRETKRCGIIWDAVRAGM